MLLISIIQLFCIVMTAFLLKNAYKTKSNLDFSTVLIGGFITLLFEPLAIELLFGQTADGGAIQLAGEIFGIYFIVRAIIGIVKNRKSKQV